MSEQLDTKALRAACDECEGAEAGGVVMIPRDLRALLDAAHEEAARG